MSVWEAEQDVPRNSIAFDLPSVVYRHFGQPWLSVERGVGVAVARLAALSRILDALTSDGELRGSAVTLAGRLGVSVDAFGVALDELVVGGHLVTEAWPAGELVVCWADEARDRLWSAA